jgi:hypothetical protein
MNYSTPESMAPGEIILEISTIQQDLQGKFARIQVLSQSLYHRVRRAKPDDNTSIYIQYANAWMRFSGMANQGALRTVHASRVLKLLAPEEEKEPSVPVKRPKPQDKPEASPVESLMSMYSDEELEDLDVPQVPEVPAEAISSEEADD